MDDNSREPRIPYTFSDPLLRWERICLFVYLALHVAVLPLLLGLLQLTWPGPSLSNAVINIIYYALGFAFMLLVLGKYLRRGFDALLDNWRWVLLAVITAYMLDVLLSVGLQLILTALGDPLGTSPNNQMVESMAGTDYNLTFAMAVFLAPVVEEPLFRGAVFGSLYKRGRLVAYAVSVLLFSLYHVWQYAFLDWHYIFYAIQYIPVSVALCCCYERSGSIWTPIFFHMMINGLSMALTA